MSEQTTNGKQGFEAFLKWEKASRDTIDFKTTYVDMTGDLESGLLLSQIIYWRLPDKKRKRKTKLTVFRNGKWWLAKRHQDWWDEIPLSKSQCMRAMKRLEKLGLIETCLWRYNGLRMTHIHIKEAAFSEAWNKALDGTDKELPQVTKRHSL